MDANCVACLGLATLLGANCALAADGECRYLVDSHGQLIIRNEDGQSLAILGEGEQARWVAAWSPDGKRILYASFPRAAGDTLYIRLANASGEDQGRVRVTAAEPRDWDIQWIGEIHWLDDSRFWYDGTLGLHGGYVDVWTIARRFEGSQLESRLAVLGGGCTLSPGRAVVACVADDPTGLAIVLFDYRKALGGDPPPQSETPEDYDAYVLAGKSMRADRGARVEGLTWGSGGRQLLFVVRRPGRLELGTLDRRGESTKGWKLELREVVGVDQGRVKAIRFGEAGYELVTDAGVYRVGREPGETATTGPTQRALVAQKVGVPEPLHPPGMSEFSILDRWCPDDGR